MIERFDSFCNESSKDDNVVLSQVPNAIRFSDIEVKVINKLTFNNTSWSYDNMIGLIDDMNFMKVQNGMKVAYKIGVESDGSDLAEFETVATTLEGFLAWLEHENFLDF